MDQHEELFSRLESGETGPEVDKDIAVLFGMDGVMAVPPYTTSLDAAKGLFDEKFPSWSKKAAGHDSTWYTELYKVGGATRAQYAGVKAHTTTEEGSWCAAMVRADGLD